MQKAEDRKIHNLTHLEMGRAYDETQTNESIKDGDFLLVQDGLAMMSRAWPVMVTGESVVFHQFIQREEADQCLQQYEALASEQAKREAVPLLASIKDQAARQVYEAHDDQDFFAANRVKDAATRERILIERAVLRRAVTDLIAAGFVLSVFDGEAMPVNNTTEVRDVMANLGACDEESILVRKRGIGNRPTAFSGSLLLVYGNEGWDVICDNSVSLEIFLTGATELAGALCEAMHAN